MCCFEQLALILIEASQELGSISQRATGIMCLVSNFNCPLFEGLICTITLA